MIDYDVQFFSNTSDGTHCFQAALKMILKYFLPNEEYPFGLLDEKTAKVNGLWTWLMAGLLWLKEKGFKIKKIGISPVFNNYSRIKKTTISTCNVLGVVEIFDETKALDAFEKGIGKERSFGYGMLCLTPLKDSITSSDEDEDYND